MIYGRIGQPLFAVHTSEENTEGVKMSLEHNNDLDALLKSLEADLAATGQKVDPAPVPVTPAPAETAIPAPPVLPVTADIPLPAAQPLADAADPLFPNMAAFAPAQQEAAAPFTAPDTAPGTDVPYPPTNYAAVPFDPAAENEIPFVLDADALVVPDGRDADKYADASGTAEDEEELPPARMPAWRKALSVLFNLTFYVVIIAMVGGSIMFGLSRNPDKDYFGYRVYTVTTNSMATPVAKAKPGDPPIQAKPGAFKKGAIILVKRCAPDEVEPGDIVTMNITPMTAEGGTPRPPVFLTHRVVEVMDELNKEPGLYFVTKGDNNNSNDPPMSAYDKFGKSKVVGKKIGHIPFVGGLLENARKHYVLALLMIISGFGCIYAAKFYFSKPVPKKAKR